MENPNNKNMEVIMEGWLEGKIKISNIENSEEFFDYLFGASYLFELMVSENQL